MRPWTFSKKPCWCDCSFLFMFILSVPSPSAIENAETRGEERKWRAPEGSDAVTNCGNSKIDRDLSKWNRDCLSSRTPLSRESSLEFVGGISPFWWELWLQDLSWSFFFFSPEHRCPMGFSVMTEMFPCVLSNRCLMELRSTWNGTKELKLKFYLALIQFNLDLREHLGLVASDNAAPDLPSCLPWHLRSIPLLWMSAAEEGLTIRHTGVSYRGAVAKGCD